MGVGGLVEDDLVPVLLEEEGDGGPVVRVPGPPGEELRPLEVVQVLGRHQVHQEQGVTRVFG